MKRKGITKRNELLLKGRLEKERYYNILYYELCVLRDLLLYFKLNQ